MVRIFSEEQYRQFQKDCDYWIDLVAQARSTQTRLIDELTEARSDELTCATQAFELKQAIDLYKVTKNFKERPNEV